MRKIMKLHVKNAFTLEVSAKCRNVLNDQKAVKVFTIFYIWFNIYAWYDCYVSAKKYNGLMRLNGWAQKPK